MLIQKSLECKSLELDNEIDSALPHAKIFKNAWDTGLQVEGNHGN